MIVNTCAVTAEAERQARQAIRRPRARAARGADRRHRLRGADRARRLRRHARGRPRRSATPRSCGRDLGRLPDGAAARWSATSWPCARRRRHLVDGLRRPRARLRPGAAGLRPPLHLLHHPLRPRAQPQRAAPARWSRRSRALVEHGYREVVLTGVDITSYGTDLPGQPSLGQLVRRLLSGAGAAAAAAVLDRPGRDRRRPVAAGRRGAAADAAPAPVAAGRRRPDPEADEAAAPAGRRVALSPSAARAAAGHRRSAPT